LEKKDKRIKVYRNKFSKGPAESRNIALKIAKGKWVSIIDSDDIFLPKKIETQVNFVNNNNNIIFVGTSLLFINEMGSHIAFYKYKNKSKILKKEIIKNKSFPPHSSYFIKKDYLLKIQGYNNRYSMAPDYDLLLRLQDFDGKNFGVCEEVLTKVRLHDENRSLKRINNYTQLDYAILANVCFNIYKRNNKNPANTLDNKEWKKFMVILKSFLKSVNYYKFLVNKLKNKRHKKINTYIKYFFSINFLKSYYIGHVLPKNFQDEFYLIYKKKFMKS
jgi:glycosyltransferase involved in cell wall biosynthesis